MFSAALQSGQLGPLMQQFGMSSEVVAAANSGGMYRIISLCVTNNKFLNCKNVQ